MSSESEQRYAMMDEKKRKRMISNRESARRSRMKKEKLMQELTGEMGRLQVGNHGIEGKIKGIGEKYMIYACENNVLRVEVKELTERLRSLNDVINNSSEVGMDADADEMFDPMLKSWQICCSMQPPLSIQASQS